MKSMLSLLMILSAGVGPVLAIDPAVASSEPSSALLKHNIASTPISWSRNEAGDAFVPVKPLPDDLDQVFRRKVNTATLKPTKMGTFLHGSARGSSSRFSPETMAVFIEDSTPSLNEAAIATIKAMGSVPGIKTIDLYPSGSMPKSGADKPDVFLRLGIKRTDTSIDFVVCGGPTFHDTFSARFSEFIPISWDISGECSWDLNDKPISKNVLQLIAIESGKYFAEKLAEFFTDMRKQLPPAPHFPASFCPAYQPLPDLPSVTALNPTIILSTRSIMCSNQTNWVFRTTKQADPLLTELQNAMEKKGWTVDRKDTGDSAFLEMNVPEKGWYFEVSLVKEDDYFWFNRFFDAPSKENENTYCITFQNNLPYQVKLEKVHNLFDNNITADQAIFVVEHLEREDALQFKDQLLALSAQMDSEDLFRLAKWVWWNCHPRPTALIRDLYFRAALKHLWLHPDSKRDLSTDWVKQFKALKAFQNLNLLPAKLTTEEQKKYGMVSVQTVLGKSIKHQINEPVAVVLSSGAVQAWTVARDVDSTTGKPSYKFNTVLSGKNQSQYLSISTSPGAERTREVEDGDKTYTALIKVSDDGTHYSVLVSLK